MRRDTALVLRVIDNGIGMSSEKLSAICALLSESALESSNRDGYGIANVNKRIQLSFGNKYGLAFESEPDLGTTVEMMHPIVEYEE